MTGKLEDDTGDIARPPLFGPRDVLGGAYEIVALLGEGGMGQVFEATDRELHRRVAIKVSWPEVGDDSLVAEARVMASLRHPGLVGVYAVRRHAGRAFLVMERLFGMSVADLLDARGRGDAFELGEALDILIPVADALAAVHRAGLVHRDLKPDNIVLEPGNRAVLLDFGVFHSERDAEAQQRIYGSPHYMAPETIQRSVRAGQAHLVDVYAFGATAFEILTGNPPFDDTSVRQLLGKHLRHPAPALTSVLPHASPHLTRLVADMLAKDPARRPCSMEVVATWLRAVRRGLGDGELSRPLSVLVADDDPDIRGLLHACVEQAAPGAAIRTADDGEQALRAFRADPPDVLLLDLQMPRMTGVELCMNLRGTSVSDQTTIVAVSAHASGRDRRLLEHLGVVDFVDKKTSQGKLMFELIELIQGIHTTRERVLHLIT